MDVIKSTQNTLVQIEFNDKDLNALEKFWNQVSDVGGDERDAFDDIDGETQEAILWILREIAEHLAEARRYA